MKNTRANIIILSGAEMTIMNGGMKANIPVRKIQKILIAQICFCQRSSIIDTLLTRVENECEEKVKVVASS